MIYLIVGVLVLQAMTLGAVAYSHGLTEQRLSNERKRSDGLTAAMLTISGEPRAAKQVTGEAEARPVNYRRAEGQRQVGLTARMR